MGIVDKAAVLNTTPFRKFRLEGDLFVFSMILIFIYRSFNRLYNKLMIYKLKCLIALPRFGKILLQEELV
jgi:hypothetical protein